MKGKNPPKSVILDRILVVLSSGAFVLSAVTLLLDQPRSFSMSIQSLLAFGICFLIYKSGKEKIASHGLILYLLGLTMQASLVGNGIQDSIIIMSPVIYLCASLLLEKTGYIVASALSLLSLVWIAYQESNGMLVTKFSHLMSTLDAYVTIILLAVTSLLIYMLMNSLKTANRNLMASEEEYRTIFDSAGDAIFLMDLETRRIEDANSMMLEIHGFDNKQDLLNKTIDDICLEESPWTARDAVKYINRLKETEHILFDWKTKGKNGSSLWVEVRLRMLLRDNQKKVLAVVRDINSKKKLQAQSQQAEKLQAIGKLAGGIAHDFNNQLNGIIGFIELLKDEIQDPDQLQQLGYMEKSALKASDLNSNLLSFARKGMKKTKPVDLNELIKETLVIFNRSAAKSLNTRCSLFEAPLIVKADPTQIDSCILNLLLNAKDAVEESGQIEVLSEMVYLSEVDCSDLDVYRKDVQPGNYAKLTINDNGVGIPKEIIDRIFDPFFTSKQEGFGTGMGLPVVMGAIHSHNGAINFSSEEGMGTSFNLYLPIHHFESEDDLLQSRNQEAIQTTTNLNEKRSGKVVVIDDEESIRELIDGCLSKIGYTCHSFHSGSLAVSHFTENGGLQDVDLVILDIVMPGMSGVETLIRLRKINPNLKILLCSGFGLSNIKDDLQGYEISGFLPKPFQLSVLQQRVAELV